MKIPFVFTLNDRTYSGHFNQVSGAGTNGMWHLIIDNYYYGQLFDTEHFGWKFGGNKLFEGAPDFIAEVLMCSYDSMDLK